MAEDNRREQIRAAAERYVSSCAEYTSPFEHAKIINNWIEKDAQAQVVVEDFKKRVGDPGGTRMLDFGFGNGQFAIAFAQAGARVDGIEVNRTLLELAEENAAAQQVSVDLRLYEGEAFPYPDETFDYAYSLSVFEHVTDLRLAVRELCRTLKPGGAAYVSFPNRFSPRETHTGYWLVNYLPRPAARFVLMYFLHSNAVDELNLRFPTYFTLTHALQGLPLRIKPEYDAATAPRRFIKRVLGMFGLHFTVILPTIMVILKKDPQ
ncbi:MAG TPA: class I SAM-dependent methyltransferase [Candidatus Paceibacterota bacterium]